MIKSLMFSIYSYTMELDERYFKAQDIAQILQGKSPQVIGATVAMILQPSRYWLPTLNHAFELGDNPRADGIPFEPRTIPPNHQKKNPTRAQIIRQRDKWMR